MFPKVPQSSLGILRVPPLKTSNALKFSSEHFAKKLQLPVKNQASPKKVTLGIATAKDAGKNVTKHILPNGGFLMAMSLPEGNYHSLS